MFFGLLIDTSSESDGYPSVSLLVGNAKDFPKTQPWLKRSPKYERWKKSWDGHYTHFGFGRRICPGRYMALDVLWLAMATVLHAFHIRPEKDASGNEIIPDVKYTDGAIVQPLPFECSITPRSQISEHLIRTANPIKDNQERISRI